MLGNKTIMNIIQVIVHIIKNFLSSSHKIKLSSKKLSFSICGEASKCEVKIHTVQAINQTQTDQL